MKKAIALLLTLCLVLGLLASCAKTETDAGDTTTAAATTTAKTADTTKAAETTTKKAETTTTAAPAGPQVTPAGEFPVTTEPVKMTIGLNQIMTVEDYETNNFTKRILDETGVDLDFVLLPPTEATQKFELMVAANETLPEILSLGLGSSVVESYGANGVFIPTQDYFGTYTYYWDNSEFITDEERAYAISYRTASDGNLYGFPSFMFSAGDIPKFNLMINAKWLNAVGLEKPTNLEEFRTVLTAFRDEDPNGNGQKDELPWVSGGWNTAGIDFVVNQFIYYDVGFYLNATDGKLWMPAITEEYRESLRYMRDLVEEGLYPEINLTMTFDEVKGIENVTSEEDVKVGVIGASHVTNFDAANEIQMDYDYLPFFDAMEGRASYCPNRFATPSMNCFITRDCAYPEIAFRFLDWDMRPENSITIRYGEQGVHWEYYTDEGFAEKYPYADARAFALGLEPKYAIVDGVTAPWVSQEPQNYNWSSNLLPMCLTMKLFSATAKSTPPITEYGAATTPGEHRAYLGAKYLIGYVGATPDEVFTLPVDRYVAVGDTALAEKITSMQTYIEECKNLFCSGAMSLDSDWDSYVKTLQDMGLQDWIDAAQAAYDK